MLIKKSTQNVLFHACARNYCIDFNHIWLNYRDHRVVIAGRLNRHPTNPRWRTAAILKTVSRCNIPILTQKSEVEIFWRETAKEYLISDGPI